jgi:nitrogenase iron protein NifH
VIKACELEGRAVVKHSPDSKEAEIFRNHAKAIIENDMRVIPAPVHNLAELETMCRQHPVKMMFLQGSFLGAGPKKFFKS